MLLVVDLSCCRSATCVKEYYNKVLRAKSTRSRAFWRLGRSLLVTVVSPPYSCPLARNVMKGKPWLVSKILPTGPGNIASRRFARWFPFMPDVVPSSRVRPGNNQACITLHAWCFTLIYSLIMSLPGVCVASAIKVSASKIFHSVAWCYERLLLLLPARKNWITALSHIDSRHVLVVWLENSILLVYGMY